MKIRSGFVSNSSSSSFVVAFDTRPTTVHEMQGLLFPPNVTHFHSPYDDGAWPVATIAEIVLHEIRHKDPMDQDAVIECFRSGYIPSIYDKLEKEFPYRYSNEQTQEEREEEWAQRDALERELTYELATNWLLRDDVRGKELFHFKFSDNDGAMFCAMEHGDLFDLLPHTSISHH
jgi:hypothetical protein